MMREDMGVRLPRPGEALTVIAKLPGDVCNINCHYCFERRKPYPGAQFLTPGVLARFLTLAGGRPLALTLHGGEPLLLKPPAMAALLAELRRYDGPLTLGIQTNGLMLDNTWLDFFDREWPGLKIGLSLDGDELANSHRVDHRDRPIFGRVLRTTELLATRGRRVGLIMVVTREALGRAAEIMPRFAELGCVDIVKLASCMDFSVTSKQYPTPSGQTILRLNSTSTGRPGWATTPGEYTEFVEQAIECWRSTGLFRNFLLEPALSALRAVTHRPTEFTEFSDRKEPFIVTLYPDGRIGSSDHFDMPSALLGHVDEIDNLDEVLDFHTNTALLASLNELSEYCSGCRHQLTCRGGSLADRLRYHQGGLAEDYCDARRNLLDFVERELVTVMPSASRPHESDPAR
jgi:radical SAM protein with 4Fe4S-binding SPASM domain